jgi:hypothetical protein
VKSIGVLEMMHLSDPGMNFVQPLSRLAVLESILGTLWSPDRAPASALGKIEVCQLARVAWKA